MRSTIFTAAFVGAASAHLYHNTTTKVVPTLTTYCPHPTTITHGTNTYTVTEPTTLTITDCPCTVTEPVTKPTTITTETVPEFTTYCPSPTTFVHHNQTYTVTEPTTLTIINCPGGCTKPVHETEYTTVTVPTITTYCPAPTTITHGTQTYTVTEPTTLTISDCPGGCVVTKPIVTPIPLPTPIGEVPAVPSAPATCPEECTHAYDMCRVHSGDSMSTCASEFSQCLGYNPFAEDGSLITPTACSTGVTMPTEHMPAPTGGEEAPMPPPAGGDEAPTPPPTAGAEQLAPYGVLMAVGVIALI